MVAEPCRTFVQRITYAKTKSDAVAKSEGTYVEKDKTARQKHNQEQRGGLPSIIMVPVSRHYAAWLVCPLLITFCEVAVALQVLLAVIMQVMSHH